VIVSLDFELASPLDLSEVGADVWTKHEDTAPILCGYAIDDDEPESIDFDEIGQEDGLLNAIANGAQIHAWNANFEWNVWNNICALRYGWPKLDISRFHCTMCAAACAGLPMSLDEAAPAVGSPYVKDKAGRALMLRMARPRSFKNGVYRWWHEEDPVKLAQLSVYNRADVIAEREVRKRIPRMSRRERIIWLVDQDMNARGLPVDNKLLEALDGLTLQELLTLNGRIRTLTNGAVAGSTQNLKLLQWVNANGYPHPTLERDTLLAFLQTPEFRALDPVTQGVLMARGEAAKTSTAKLISVGHYAQIDGYARNLIQYGGAVRTLRWSGRGPQIQNFPRPVIDETLIEPATESILQGMDAEGLRTLYGNPLDVVSSCLRGLFKAPRGYSFVVCDYHAIEAIVLGWLAEDEDLLDVFRRDEDVYVFNARRVGSSNRQLGKVLTLACGYGMGHVKFVESAAKYRLYLTLSEAKDAVDAYRAANPAIVSFWHGVEATAKKAFYNPADEYTYRKLKFRMAKPAPESKVAGSLLMELPSGRRLVYRNVRVAHGRIEFWGVHQTTKRWGQLDTYGGKLVENATQAVARDLLADAIVDLDRYWPGALRATIHDEIVAMIDDDSADALLVAMREIMSQPPSWGSGLPISAKGAVLKRYKKL